MLRSAARNKATPCAPGCAATPAANAKDDAVCSTNVTTPGSLEAHWSVRFTAGCWTGVAVQPVLSQPVSSRFRQIQGKNREFGGFDPSCRPNPLR